MAATLPEKLLKRSVRRHDRNGIVSEEMLALIFERTNSSYFSGEVPVSRCKWSDRIGVGKNCHRIADFTVFDDQHFPPVIRLSKVILGKANLPRIAEVLYKEMMHVWLWSKGHSWEQCSQVQIQADEFRFLDLNIDESAEVVITYDRVVNLN